MKKGKKITAVVLAGSLLLTSVPYSASSAQMRSPVLQEVLLYRKCLSQCLQLHLYSMESLIPEVLSVLIFLQVLHLLVQGAENEMVR